jgi:hypothetical protein
MPAGVVALEAQSGGGDRAVQRVQGREAHRAFARGGEPFHVAADDMRLVLGRLAVWAHGDAVAQRARPVGDVGRLI